MILLSYLLMSFWQLKRSSTLRDILALTCVPTSSMELARSIFSVTVAVRSVPGLQMKVTNPFLVNI